VSISPLYLLRNCHNPENYRREECASPIPRCKMQGVRVTGVRKENFVSRKMFLICNSGLHSDKEGSQSTRSPGDVLAYLWAGPVTMVKLQEKVRECCVACWHADSDDCPKTVHTSMWTGNSIMQKYSVLEQQTENYIGNFTWKICWKSMNTCRMCGSHQRGTQAEFSCINSCHKQSATNST
jgi:hypothetical protein